MRYLFLVLLLANAAFFAWNYLERGGDAAAGAGSSDMTADAAAAPRLRLLREQSAAVPDAVDGQGGAAGCYRLGPFGDDAALMERVMHWFTEQGIKAAPYLGDGRETGNFRVYLPPLSSREEAVKVLDQLQAHGATDSYVMATDSQRNAIALGVFSSKAAAEARLNEVRQWGYAAQMDEQYVPLQQAWVDVGESGQSASGISWDEFSKAFSQVGYRSRACD